MESVSRSDWDSYSFGATLVIYQYDIFTFRVLFVRKVDFPTRQVLTRVVSSVFGELRLKNLTNRTFNKKKTFG